MRNIDTQIDRPYPDEEFRDEFEVPEEIDYWNINEFGDFLPAGESMVSGQY